MSLSPRLRSALVHLLDDVSEGKRLSELTSRQRKLVRYADKFGYVTQTPIKDGDWIVTGTGRRP